MPVAEARGILGKEFIIGGTANTFDDVKMHYKAGADYIGCGPFRFTTTKKDLSPVLGLEGYRSIILQMKEANIHLPIVAIGGNYFGRYPFHHGNGNHRYCLERNHTPGEKTR